MKTKLRIAAVVLVFAAVGYWLVTGAHVGWSEMNIEHGVPDPVTGLEGVAYKKGFVPGVDFLAGAAVTAGILAAVSFLLKSKSADK